MNAVTISPATEEEVRAGDIGRRLRHFNYGVVGEYPEVQPVRLNARTHDGRVVGGLRGFVFLYWLRVEVLFVDEDSRGTGIGSSLLLDAERSAREHGARNAAVETFEWQAPGFYEKHGYAEVARIEGYANGYYLAIMRKVL
jgi:GNAT superfamily N-acetyltransferase